jgi:hypothetical protein
MKTASGLNWSMKALDVAVLAPWWLAFIANTRPAVLLPAFSKFCIWFSCAVSISPPT